MTTQNPTASVATITLSDDERAALIYEARMVGRRWADRLDGILDDAVDDKKAGDILEGARDNLDDAYRALSAAINPELFEATSEMQELVEWLRDGLFQAATVNGEWYLDNDPAEAEDRKRFEVLAVLAARITNLRSVVS